MPVISQSSRLLFMASSVVMLAGAAPALAGLSGSTIDVGYYYPDLSTLYAGATATPPTFVVGAGSESTVAVEGPTWIDVDFSDTTLTLDFTTVLNSPTWNPASFNGLVFTGPALATITGISLDPSSTFGFNIANATLAGNDLRLNWAGVSYNDGQVLKLTFAFVPEPATWALLIAGFGMVGLAARRRRARLASIG